MPSEYHKQSFELGQQFQQNNSKNWARPDLYWWFRNTDHPINDWYKI
jgi:hypothetical protein